MKHWMQKAMSRENSALRREMELLRNEPDMNLQICALYPTMQFLLEPQR
jgi:hypothetical protein